MDTNLTQDFFDRIGKRYESAYSHDKGLIAFINAAIQELPAGSMVLDVGCGTGNPVSSMLAASGLRVLGIDRSKVMIDLCRVQVPNASFEQVDMLSYDPPSRFDAIFPILSLFALSRQQMTDLLLKFSQWLRPQGKLYIAIVAAEDDPNAASHYDSDGLYAGGINNEFMGETVKIALLSKEGWRVFLEQAGFRISSTSEHDFVPPSDAQSATERHYFIRAEKV